MKLSEISLSSIAIWSVTEIMGGSYGIQRPTHPPGPVDPTIKSSYLPRLTAADPSFCCPVGDSLTVEQRTLTPLVEVRILVPQPSKSPRILVPSHRNPP